MKRVCLLFVLAFGLHAASLAGIDREVEHPASIENRAIALTRAVASKVHLDEGQYLKLKRINVRMLTAVNNVKNHFGSSSAMSDEHLAAIQANYQSELLELLRPAQLVAYQQMQSNRTALNKPKE